MKRGGSVARVPGEKYIDLRNHRIRDDAPFVEPHVYRQVRRIDMGPVVEAALAAVYERRWRRASIAN